MALRHFLHYPGLFLPLRSSVSVLAVFQTYKENAPECMTMVHYPELAETKGIVLMAAEYDSTALVSRATYRTRCGRGGGGTSTVMQAITH